MSQQIAVRIAEDKLAALDQVVAEGSFSSRAEALRAGLDMLLREERSKAITESYRRAYEKHPQEEWIGETGALLAGEALGKHSQSGSE